MERKEGTIKSVSQYPNEDRSGDMDMYMEEDTNVTMYPFTVSITDDAKDRRQGFHVSLEVNLGGDKKIAVPHMAIMNDLMMDIEDEDSDMVDDMFGMDDEFMQEGTSFVYVLIDGALEKRDIETGNMNDEFVEKIDGVKLDEVVINTPTPEMYDPMMNLS